LATRGAVSLAAGRRRQQYERTCWGQPGGTDVFEWISLGYLTNSKRTKKEKDR